MLRDNEFDRELLSRVMPNGFTNPEPSSPYNLVVVGAGTAGLVAASGAAQLGARVALIERTAMGGDCLNVGCVPSKSLLRSAHAVAEIRRAEELGIRVHGRVEVDFGAVMDRMREIRARIAPNDSVARFRDELGVDVFLGEGRFTDRQVIEVGDQKLEFRRALIATGARARIPEIPGLDQIDYLTNETIFDLETQPEHLLVLGGGPIGCELAQAFCRLGSRVTVVEADQQFLPREDPDAAQSLLESFQKDGIDVRLATRLEAVEIGADGAHQAKLANAKTSDVVVFDRLLVAVGRSPNVEELGLEEAGIDYDTERGVHISDTFQTRNPAVYAAGDVCLPHKFTHAANFAARAVIQNALFSVGPLGKKKWSTLTVPWCTYTDPEIAHVGLSEQEAGERGQQLDSFTCEFADVDRAIAESRDDGFVRIHLEHGRDRIVGATVVAPNAGDLISEICVAMEAGMGLSGLASVIHPYPTRAEAIRQTGDARNRTRLTPLAGRLLEGYLRWRR